MPINVINYAKSIQAGGKFVVLRRRADADFGVILFSDFTQDFQHADIVRRWQRATGTSPQEAGCHIAGGGWWKMEEGGVLVLYGQSAAYGRFDRGWLKGRLPTEQIFHESRIDVR